MRVPESIIEEIYQAIDPIQVATSYVQDLNKAGTVWKGKSPFQNEKTASFVVWPHTKTWRCYSSGKGGKMPGLIMECEGVGYRTAIEILAKQYGIEINSDQSPSEKEAAGKQQQIRAHLNRAAKFFHSNLLTKAEFPRNLTHKIAEEWQIGLSPDGWDILSQNAKDQGIAPEALIEAGLTKVSSKKTHIDVFRNRLMLPIHDWMGNIVGFGARAIDPAEQVKYINSSESVVYKKSEILFGLHRAKQAIMKADACLIVEGYFDVITPYAAGIKNIVATCGTSLTDDHARIISRFTSNVTLVFDGDTPGQKATRRSIKTLLAAGLTPNILTLPDDHDPDSFIQTHGKEAWAQLETQDWISYLITSKDISDPKQKIQVAKEITLLIDTIPYDIDRQVYQEAASLRLNINLNGQQPKKETNLAQETDHNLAGGEKVHRANLAEFQLGLRRRWKDYEIICSRMGWKPCEDFLRSDDGGIEIHYRDIKGDPFMIEREKQKVAAVRITTQRSSRPNAVYIPPAVREIYENEDIKEEDVAGIPLLIVRDEITAWMLSEMGQPALGINRLDGFTVKPGSKSLHKTISQVLSLGFRRSIYLMSGEAFSLPPAPRKASENPYSSIDAGAVAEAYVSALIAMKEAWADRNIYLVYPALESTYLDAKDMHWVDRLILSILSEYPIQHPGEVGYASSLTIHAPNRRDILEAEIIREIRNMMSQPVSDLYAAINVSDTTQAGYRKLVRLSSPQAFFDLHGLEKLGETFQLGNYLYEVDRDLQVKVQDKAIALQSIVERDGIYWARNRDGEKNITDFIFLPKLKILSDTVYVMSEIESVYGKKVPVVLQGTMFTDANAFYLEMFRLGDFFFTGTSSQLKEVFKLVMRGIDTAHLADSLGLRQVPGTEEEAYVMGNGVITEEGVFIGADESGLVDIEGEKICLPAVSPYKFSASHDKNYKMHSNFRYESSEYDLKSWISLMFGAYPSLAHVGIAHLVATVCRDIIFAANENFPLFSLQGEASAGKTSFVNSITAPFGKVMQMGLESDSTLASANSLPGLVRCGPCVFNEFNVFKLAKKKSWAIDLMKALYDGQGRTTRQSAHTEFLNMREAVSAPICVGQQAFYKYDEAVNQRFIILEHQDGTHTDSMTKHYRELKNIVEPSGLGHLLAQFISFRKVIAEKFSAAQQAVQDQLKNRMGFRKTKTRFIENWGAIITPLIILLDEGLIAYPLSKKEILDDAAARIIDHSEKAVSEGILGEFWAFIQTQFGRKGGIDDRHVFVYRREDGKTELRLRLKELHRLFCADITRQGDASVTAPSYRELFTALKAMKEGAAYLGESKTYMGYVRAAGSDLPTLGDRNKFVYASRHCHRFDYEEVGIELSEIKYLEGTEEPELATA